MRSGKVRLLPRMGFFFFILLSLSACALLFPDRTAPKSTDYLVTTPNAPWKKMDVTNDSTSLDALRADLAYENPETGAIISLNTLCRKYNESTLEELTLNLVRDIDDRDLVSKKLRKIANVDALDTVYAGIVDKVHLMINTVVLVKNYCTYDFIYVGVEKQEKDSHKAFEAFVNSFRVD